MSQHAMDSHGTSGEGGICLPPPGVKGGGGVKADTRHCQPVAHAGLPATGGQWEDQHQGGGGGGQ
jgi:hypothetical protein